jgi:hypothetical protein
VRVVARKVIAREAFCGKRCGRSILREAIAYGKKIIFLYSRHLAQGGHGWPRGSNVASDDLGLPWGSRVEVGVTDVLVGLLMASGVCGWPCGVMDGHRVLRVAFGVTFDLKGSRMTLITCQIFTNVPKFRIK